MPQYRSDIQKIGKLNLTEKEIIQIHGRKIAINNAIYTDKNGTVYVGTVNGRLSKTEGVFKQSTDNLNESIDEINETIESIRVFQATEELSGIAEIATQAETNAGTDDTRIVTPKKLNDFITASQLTFADVWALNTLMNC